MKAWITKYALTKGILFVADARYHGGQTNMLIVRRGSTAYYHNNDWHRDEATAIAHAEKMRVAKIASLQKQIAKLEAVTFRNAGSGGVL